MRHRKKITWNAGQKPEIAKRPRLPPYVSEPEIIDENLKQAWNNSFVGQICVANTHLICYSNPSYYTSNGFPYPLLNPVDSNDLFINTTEIHVPINHPVIYLGRTYVDCVGTKSKIIKRPYISIFFGGGKYLIPDPNALKPIFE